jgi:hypothetical protein
MCAFSGIRFKFQAQIWEGRWTCWVRYHYPSFYSRKGKVNRMDHSNSSFSLESFEDKNIGNWILWGFGYRNYSRNYGFLIVSKVLCKKRSRERRGLSFDIELGNLGLGFRN